jgi:oligoribonuclease NrnB/cAMP/cGMP phosphodiesterase (DHH superfamily)
VNTPEDKLLCIYHGACDDGFGAAWAVRHALGDSVEFYPGVYQAPPPDATGRDVLLVDFSYKKPVLEQLESVARSVLILDHHKTAAEDLASVRSPPNTSPGWSPLSGMWAVFDMERSGAALAWDFFHGDPRPPFIEYIQDRDLWRKKLPGVDDFTVALRSYPQDFNTWDGLVERGVSDLISEGKIIGRYYRLRCEEFKKSAYRTHIAGVPCVISNAPYFVASEVAGELAAESGLDFGACYFEVERGKFQYSLRSRGDLDVSDVARKFGGGGHKNAAGFSALGVVHRE